MGDSLKTMQKATNTAATEILITLAPAITTITNKISEFLAKGNNRKRFDLTSIPTPMADAIMPTGSTSRTPEQIAADIAAQQEKIKKILASKEKGGTKDTETWWQKNRTDVILKEREIQKKQHEDSDKAVDEFIEKNSKRVQSAEEKDLAVISDIRGQRTQMEADYDEIINKNAYAQADLRHKNLLEKTKDFTNAQYDVERIASIDRALIAKKEHDMKINYMQDLAMGFGDTMVMMGLASKASAIEQKRLAQLSAIINTAVAASKANSATPYPPINAALMAIAIAQGLAQVAIIQNQKFAAGTLRAPGGMAMVGEFGPEMMYVPGGARIYNNRETNNMIGGNKSVNITLNVGGGSNMSSRDADRITRSLNDLANGLIEAERHGKLEDFKRVMR
jgi:hypothetical protein